MRDLDMTPAPGERLALHLDRPAGHGFVDRYVTSRRDYELALLRTLEDETRPGTRLRGVRYQGTRPAAVLLEAHRDEHAWHFAEVPS